MISLEVRKGSGFFERFELGNRWTWVRVCSKFDVHEKSVNWRGWVEYFRNLCAHWNNALLHIRSSMYLVPMLVPVWQKTRCSQGPNFWYQNKQQVDSSKIVQSRIYGCKTSKVFWNWEKVFKTHWFEYLNQTMLLP